MILRRSRFTGSADLPGRGRGSVGPGGSALFMLVDLVMGMVVRVVMIMVVVMLLGLHLRRRIRVHLGEGLALGLLVRLQMALLVFFPRTTGTLVVAARLESGLPVIVRHKSSKL